MPDRDPGVTTVVLAGGEATRLPGKLFRTAGNEPLLVRVARNAGTAFPLVLACKEPLPEAVGAAIGAPQIVDRWKLRGPLAGLLTVFERITTPWAFAIAGDAPYVDAAFLVRLLAARQDGDEAIVPRYDIGGKTRIEPLAALYAREAFLREGLPILTAGDAALKTVVRKLNTRFLDVPGARTFTNVNTEADWAELIATLA